MMHVNWIKCRPNNSWCGFYTVDLTTVPKDTHGVYIIWNATGQTIRVGQGYIVTRISEHRRDYNITMHSPQFVTWATGLLFLEGRIEKYLANSLLPLAGLVYPDAVPLEVNLPEPLIRYGQG